MRPEEKGKTAEGGDLEERALGEAGDGDLGTV